MLSQVFLKKIAGTMQANVYSDFEQAWKADLGILVEFANKQDVLDVANAYLAYYGASNRVIDCRYDPKAGGYLWEIRPEDKNDYA